MALKAADVPLESIYKLSDRSGDRQFTKFYRFKNVKLLNEQGKPGKKQTVEYSVTYKRRKAGPELNAARKRQPL